MAEVLSPEQQMHWWWLSFADPDRTEGEQFLGVAIVLAASFFDAVTASHLLGVNPGGQLSGAAIPWDHLPPEQYRSRLLAREEAEEAAKY